MRRPAGYTPRRDTGLTGFERVLARAGLGPVAGIDEAGRGACAGPLVVAAVVLGRWRGDARVGLADSKLLTARAREQAYREITRSALAWNVVVIEPGEIDRRGLHVCNVAGMRQALAGLAASPGYVLTDGFEVPGLAVPALAMWKADQVAACVAAASIVAKVTRDAIMRSLHDRYPAYGFATHKGYSTRSHMAALEVHGPSAIHRRSFCNVPPGPVSGTRGTGGSGGTALGRLDTGRDGLIVDVIASSPSAGPGAGTEPASVPGGSAEGRI